MKLNTNKFLVDTAVFPVAGMGTRFLPITKAGPKEMLPIVDKPIIQYAVEEAISAGIKHLIFVTSSSKRAIEDYFDSNYELEARLAEKGKLKALQQVKDILPSDVNISYVRQKSPLGLGHAVLCAKQVIGEKPFAVLLPDDVIDSPQKSCLHSMQERFSATQSSVIAVEQVALEETDKYGIVAIAKRDERFANITRIVEKPAPSEAPSNLAVTGRYILTPEIFHLLAATPQGSGGEIQLTDAIAQLLLKQTVEAFIFEGRRYDCGSKLGWLKATLSYALRRDDLRLRLWDYLKEIIEHDTVY